MDECIYSIFRPLWLRPIIEINISNNALGITGSKVFSQFLEKSQSLKRLLIANCGLGGTGSKEILNKVHNCTSL
jgi:Ran GTPase-activating protein (RanGAP) involved in mRNA processing and transport